MRRTGAREDEGFTLVELLVVTLIIGVLAGIALPSMLRHRQKAWRASMAADLHSAVTAELAYRTENASWATDPAALEDEGYRASSGVAPVHVKVAGEVFLACVKHENITSWLVYDSSTGDTSTSGTDCAI